jgi:hypothetical protein
MQRYHAAGVELSRDQTKRSTYGFFFGGDAKQMAIELTKDAFTKGEGITVDEAATERLRQLFYSLLPGVRKWHHSSSAEVARSRSLKSLTGRKRWWLGYITQVVKSSAVRPTDYVVQQFEKNGKRMSQILSRKVQKELWSFQPQDMEAWVLADAIERLATLGAQRGLPVLTPEQFANDPTQGLAQLLHVHDEVVISAPAARAAEARALIQEAFTVEMWGMTFTTDAGDPALNWKDAKGE